MNIQGRKDGGFTLVELIIVIAILAVLGSIAVPNLIGYVEKSRTAADEATAKLIADAATMYVAEIGQVPANVTKPLKDVPTAPTSGAKPSLEYYVYETLSKKWPKVKSKEYLKTTGSDKDVFTLKLTTDGGVTVSCNKVIVTR